METRPMTIYGYELITPKFYNKRYDIDRFDFEVVKYLFEKIISDNTLEERAYIGDDKMINLISFKQSDDSRLFEGEFITARYGKEQEILDIFKQVETGVKPKDHGVKNTVNFLIDSKTGLLLLEKDSEQVASAKMFHNFIRFHRETIEEYLEAFNKQNSPFKMHKQNFLKIRSLPSKTFFEELHEFATIKNAFYYLDISEMESANNEASNLLHLYNKADEGGVKGVTRVKVSLENKIRKGTVRGIKKYFEKLFEFQYFDGFGVSGKLESGRERTIELENIQRAFDVRVTYNDSGIPSISEIIESMSRIALTDNPLDHKERIKQFKGVVINDQKEEGGAI